MDDLERLGDLRERLLRADAELSAFFDHSAELVCELDPTGKFKRLNSRWVREFGYSPAELQERPWIDLVHPDDVNSTQAALAELEEKERVQFQHRFRHKDGSYRTLLWTAIQWPAAEVTLAIGADLTRRRDDERALYELHRLQDQVIESAHVGVIVCDRDLKFIVWNPFLERLSGMRAEQVVGKRAPQLFPLLCDAKVLELTRRALAGEAVTSPDLQYPAPDTGESVWLSVRLSPYRSLDGHIIGLIVFLHDITDRQRMQEELDLGRPPVKEAEVMDVNDSYHLSPRERTVLKFVVEGRSNKEIATTLAVTPTTVNTHVASILRKMHATSRSEAAARAVRERLAS